MRFNNRLLSTFLVALGGFLGLGATGEIVLAIDPGLLPAEAIEIPFMAAHQTSWALRTWVLASNIVNLGCAITLVRSALAIRGGRDGWSHLRIATGTLAWIAITGILICLPYLLPLPAGPTRDSSQFMLASVVGGGAALATLCLLLFRFASSIIRSSIRTRSETAATSLPGASRPDRRPR